MPIERRFGLIGHTLLFALSASTTVALRPAAAQDAPEASREERATNGPQDAIDGIFAEAPASSVEAGRGEAEDGAGGGAATAPPEVDRTTGRIEEIIVTAQKREQNIQDVPLSITAIDGEDIKELNMADLNTVAAYAPNLRILATPTFNFIYMRGVGSDYNRGFEQSVGIVIDEVFYGRPSYVSNGLLDLAGVEVLRGPQGTLYGKNSAAGAVHLKTADPTPDPTFDVDGLYGPRNHHRVRVAGGGPVYFDNLSFRAAFLDEAQDGDIINTTLNGREERNLDNTNYRLKLLWEATSDLSVLLTGNGSTVDQNGSGTQLTLARPRHLAAMQVFDPRTSDDVFDDRTHQNDAGFVERDVFDVSARVAWELGESTITSITNYAQFDELVFFDADFSPIPFLTLDNNELYDQISQELRWTSGPGRLEYIGGFFFYRNNVEATYDVDGYATLEEIFALTGEGEILAFYRANPDPGARREFIDQSNGNVPAGTAAGEQTRDRQGAFGTPLLERSGTLFDQTTNSYALFGQATWHFWDRWSATSGLRLDYEEKDLLADHVLVNYDPSGQGTGGGPGIEGNGNPFDTQGRPQENFVPGGATTFPVIQGGNTDFTAKRDRREFNVAPMVSTQFDWTDELMTYVTIAQGFKSGGFNAQPLNVGQLEYEEEVSWAFETGFKSDWLGGAARLNVSAFYSLFDDMQVSAFNGVSFVVSNAASATIRGIEWETLFVPLPVLFLSANGALTDAVYGDFKTGPCGAESGLNAPCDLSGKRLSNVPETQATLNAAFDDQLFGLPFRVHAGISASYSSAMFFARDLDPVDVRDPFWYLRGQTGLHGLDDTWQLMVFVENLGDAAALAGNSDVPTFRGSHFGGRLPTTEVSVSARYRF